MNEIQPSENPLPLRQTEDGTWEVQNTSEHWLSCDSEAEAKAISNAPLIMDRSFQVVYPDENIAKQLEETANILEKYNIGFGSRFLRQRAKVARGEEK